MAEIFEAKISELQTRIKRLEQKEFKKDLAVWRVFIVPIIENYQKDIGRFSWYLKKITAYDQKAFEENYLDTEAILAGANIISLISQYTGLTKVNGNYFPN